MRLDGPSSPPKRPTNRTEAKLTLRDSRAPVTERSQPSPCPGLASHAQFPRPMGALVGPQSAFRRYRARRDFFGGIV